MVFQPSYKLLLSLELLKIPRERERLSEEERESFKLFRYTIILYLKPIPRSDFHRTANSAILLCPFT